MAAKKTGKKVETYGKRKDYGARFRVITFFVGLIIFVALLSIGASFIDENFEGGEAITGAVGAASGNVEVSPPSKGSTTKITTGNGKVVIEQGGAQVEFEPINFDFSLLETDPIIQDLPKKAVIALKVGGSEYTITKSSVEKVKASEPDLIISIPGKYLSSFSGGLCEMVREANNAGELVITPQISQTGLAWKYRGMMEYRDCLGL
jgi:hypothetical protein